MVTGDLRVWTGVWLWLHGQSMQLNQMHFLLSVAILLNDSYQGENCGAWEISQVQSVQSCEVGKESQASEKKCSISEKRTL